MKRYHLLFSNWIECDNCYAYFKDRYSEAIDNHKNSNDIGEFHRPSWIMITANVTDEELCVLRLKCNIIKAVAFDRDNT